MSDDLSARARDLREALTGLLQTLWKAEGIIGNIGAAAAWDIIKEMSRRGWQRRRSGSQDAVDPASLDRDAASAEAIMDEIRVLALRHRSGDEVTLAEVAALKARAAHVGIDEPTLFAMIATWNEMAGSLGKDR